MNNERRMLSQLLREKEEDTEPVVPFAAMFGDDVKIVTAVLERTAVLSEPSDRYDRKSVRHDQVLVDPAVIVWRTRTSNYEGNRILNDRMKPGSDEAKGSMHLLRQPRKSGSHWRRSVPITPGNVPGEAARLTSDERALTSQRDVEATKQRELAAHRQQSQRRHEEEAMLEIRNMQQPNVVEVLVKPEKTKRCVVCGNEKPASAFPVGPRGPQRCLQCRATVPVPAVVEKALSTVREKKVRKPRLKKGRATGKPRRGKKIKLGETALLVSKGPHDNVVKLLEKRDSLRRQLTDVQAQLAEAIAG